jgi:DNA repair exonuclease SbcCD nuclease subunit
MKIALVADVHFGLQGRTDDILYSMRAIREYNRNNGIETWIILGDLFHDRRGVAWDVIGKVSKFFEETTEKYGQNVISTIGNHDMFMKNEWTYHSMSALKGVLKVIDDIALIKVGDQRFRIIPFIHYEDVFMGVVNSILKDKDTARDDIILTHCGVKDASLNECFLLKYWSVVDFTDVPHKVFTGHFHCHQQVGDNLWYPGSPLAFNFSEGMVDHGFIVYDTESGDHEFVSLQSASQSVAEEDRVLFPASGKPAKFITVTDDLLRDQSMLNLVDLPGNNVRIAISRDYSKEEISDIRNTLMGKGAKNVTLMRLKEQEVELSDEERSGLSVGKPEELLRVWLEKDKPDHISKDLLLSLNKAVIEEGNERVVAGMGSEEE